MGSKQEVDNGTNRERELPAAIIGLIQKSNFGSLRF